MATQCTLPAAPATSAAERLITADASLIAIQKCIPAGRLEIIELPVADGPEKRPDPKCNQGKTKRHEYEQDVHGSRRPGGR